jgi:hypothetical protein
VTNEPLDAHPIVGALAPAGRPLNLAAEDRTRALALLNTAIDYGVTALSDLDGARNPLAHDDIVDLLVQLRDLRDLLSPDPAMERPIGDEILQEWMR